MTSISSTNIRFSDLRTRFNADGNAGLSTSSPIKFSDFRGAILYKDLNKRVISYSGPININDIKGTVFMNLTQTTGLVEENYNDEWNTSFTGNGNLGTSAGAMFYLKTFTSTNKTDNSYAYVKFRAYGNSTRTWNLYLYVDSEAGYDWAVIWKNDTVLVQKSGQGVYWPTRQYNFVPVYHYESITGGDTLEFAYIKDGSVSEHNDSATFYILGT